MDYTITDDPNENVSNKYASIAAVHNVLQQLLTLGFAAVPVGAIMFWPYNQVTNPIPPRWAPLYGASNGTPIDLRGKFIRCGDNDTVGGIGGADTVTHTHAGQANPTALTVGQLPNFSLSTRCTPNIKFDEYSGGYPALSPGDFAENIQHRTSSIGNGETHSHSVTIDYTTTNNLPSYYTLIPIIYTGVI